VDLTLISLFLDRSIIRIIGDRVDDPVDDPVDDRRCVDNVKLGGGNLCSTNVFPSGIGERVARWFL